MALRKGRSWYATIASHRKRAWVVVPEAEVMLVIGQFVDPSDPDRPPHEATKAGYEPVLLSFRKGKYGLTLDLTLMTAEEITAVKKVIDIAVERGLQVAEKLDAQAQMTFESGDTEVPMRAFRMKPSLVIRHLEIKGIDA